MEDVILYKRRFAVLASFCYCIFVYNWVQSRAVILNPSYAIYHDALNEASFPEPGIDSLTITGAATLCIWYIPAALLVDRFGLILSVVGAVGVAVGDWVWYLSFSSIEGVIVAKALIAVFGALITVGLLHISNYWFAPSERIYATAVMTVMAFLGNAASVVLGPMFRTSELLIDTSLKSCKPSSSLSEFLETEAANQTTVLCKDFSEAQDQFCCTFYADIETYNMVCAIASTFGGILAVTFIRNTPPTPPSVSGYEKDGLRIMIGIKKAANCVPFLMVSLTDFLMSGPPIVFFSALPRMLPEQLAGYDSLAGGGAIGMSIFAGFFAARYITKHKIFYEAVRACYIGGGSLWIIATILRQIGTDVTDALFLGIGTFSVVLYIVWNVAVYELKLEYLWDENYSMEGFVVGCDRLVLNLASVVFLSTIAPEQVGSAQTTMWIGSGLMAVGILPVLLTPNKRAYARKHFESNKEEKQLNSNTEDMI